MSNSMVWTPDRGGLRAASATEVMNMTRAQARFYASRARYNIAPCGRRSGKTAIAKRRGVRKALEWTGVPARFIFGAPTQLQAKTIFWRDIKRMVPAELIVGKPSEGELTMELVNSATLQVMGFDKPQRAEGTPVAHVALDEFANMHPGVWTDNIRPMLTDTQGTADVFGVPEGRNHYWDVWQQALLNETGEWAAHHWYTADVLANYLGEEAATREIRSARAALDVMTFRQEYEASFNNIEGRVYYPFTRETHARESLPYDPRYPLMLCFDFNVSPGVCVYAQERPYAGDDPDVAATFTAVIGEVYIQRDSNTPAVVRRVIADFLQNPDGGKPLVHKHLGDVYLYGDPAGGSKTTAAVDGSDWDIIRDMLKPHLGDRLRWRVAREQPLQRVRVNSTNARLATVDGTKRMLVCPRRAPRTVEDFEVVTVKEGTAGEIDKKKDDGKYSHLTDAVTYLCVERYPLTSINASSSGSAM